MRARCRDEDDDHPAVDEFESCICKLSATSKAELMAYADRLGSELVSAVILKCSDLGGHSWPMSARRWQKLNRKGAGLPRSTA